MADEIYVVTKLGVTPDRFDLSQEERDALVKKGEDLIKEVGGENVYFLASLSRVGGSVVVDKYPSVAAWEKVRKGFLDIGLYKYWTMETEICRQRAP